MAVYFYCTSSPYPSGGVRVIYRHVDLLNRNGIESYVLHTQRGFRCTWFENETPVVHCESALAARVRRGFGRLLRAESPARLALVGAPSRELGEGDVLVLPEKLIPAGLNLAPGVPKVILNQNCYLSFGKFPWPTGKPVGNPYAHPDVAGVLINSEDGQRYLEHAFPGVPTHLFPLSIDPTLFRYSAAKKNQVCLSGIKNGGDALQVLNILAVRGALEGWTVRRFVNVPEREVARIMGESLLLLSFGHPEGFGLPAAEAMACGCVVAGYHGGGGREFFRPEFSFPVEVGDIVGYAALVESLLERAQADRAAFIEQGRRASEHVRERYSPAREEQSLLAFWTPLLERLGALSAAPRRRIGARH